MPKKFFTSDTHFGHSGLIEKMGRPQFRDVQDHDEHLLDRINSKVGPGDYLFELGDFCLKQPGKYRQKIKCRHIRKVMGNHDPHLATWNVFGEVPYLLEVKLENKKIAVCCHYPMAYWAKSHHGSYHFYGHAHGNREDTIDQAPMFKGRRSVDVGVDNAFKLLGDWEPFSEQELMDLLRNAEGHDDIIFYKQLRGEINA